VVVEGLAHGFHLRRNRDKTKRAALSLPWRTALVSILRATLRWIMAAIYIGFGAVHLAAAQKFLPIMPPMIPFPLQVVQVTGLCEIAGGAGLLIPRTRWLAGLMLGIYALCVWPANIYQAFWHVHVPPLPDGWGYNGPRIAFQPVLIWWALYAGGVVSWPFGRGDPFPLLWGKGS
jgi:uncharacterized membrane protein